eukprot:CAMPEP_0170625450 /NCGR_PEP_ID=MMETSP0224-20130122/30763_1 /TAXON_ID=285029 /ORGANISM="Togula jolla, Strain CCCM 725" /LENGTH=45 /DNA_ID= /DNA_START= /DNA_END= /DNA_ORIENTATION=
MRATLLALDLMQPTLDKFIGPAKNKQRSCWKTGAGSSKPKKKVHD